MYYFLKVAFHPEDSRLQLPAPQPRVSRWLQQPTRTPCLLTQTGKKPLGKPTGPSTRPNLRCQSLPGAAGDGRGKGEQALRKAGPPLAPSTSGQCTLPGRCSRLEKQRDGSVSVVAKAHLVHGRFYSARNRKKLVKQVNSGDAETNVAQHAAGSHLGRARLTTATRMQLFLLLPRVSCGYRWRQRPSCPLAGGRAAPLPSAPSDSDL